MEHPDIWLDLFEFRHQDLVREAQARRLVRAVTQKHAGAGSITTSLSRARIWRRALILALLALLCATVSAALVVAGDLDTSFGGFAGDGVVVDTGCLGITSTPIRASSRFSQTARLSRVAGPRSAAMPISASPAPTWMARATTPLAAMAR